MHRGLSSNGGAAAAGTDSRLTRRAGHHHQVHLHSSQKDRAALDLSNFLQGDPTCPSSPEQPASASSLRRHVTASLMQHHIAIERSNHALQPISPASYGSSMEVGPYNPAVTPTSSLDFKGRTRDSHYTLKTSTELLKVLNRIWSLEEQHASNISLIKALKSELDHARVKMKELLRQRQADHTEMDGLVKQIAEDKLVRRNKEQDRIQAAVKSVRDELEDERKLRKRSESLHRKLAREISEVKSSLSNALKEVERERKSRIMLEDLCDEFAKGVKDYEQEVHSLKQKSSDKKSNRDRLIVHVAESWLDERMQMQQEAQNGGVMEKNNSIIEKFQVEIERFLKAKQINSLQKDRRNSLESVPLNEAMSAPQAVGGKDDEDSLGSDSHCFEINNDDQAKKKISGSHERSKSQTLSSLQAKFEGQMAWAMACTGNGNNNKVNLLEVNPEPEEETAKQCDEVHGLDTNNKNSNNSHMLDELMRNQLSLTDSGRVDPQGSYGEASCSQSGWRKQASPNLEISESSTKMPMVGLKDNTLKAKLIEARSKGYRTRFKVFKGSS